MEAERRRAALAIAVKDATEIWRDGRFRWAAGLLLALLVAAVAGGVHNQSEIARQHADAQQAERDVWLDKGDMNPHAAAHYGAFVFKPVQPLSAIDPGLDPFVGVFVFLEAHKQQLARHRPIEDATPTRRLGQLTPASAALVLLPLLVVALTFSSFAGERDQGTLRPLLAVGISRQALLMGKALGATLPLAAVIIPATLIGAAILCWNAPADPDAPIGARAAGMGGVYLVHTLIWTGLGLAVSARARSQGAALVVLLALWFANAFIMPPMAMAAAKWVDPSPSALEFAASIQDEKDSWPTWDQRVDKVMERFLDGEFESTMAPANVEVVALLESEADETALVRSPLRGTVRALRAPGAKLRAHRRDCANTCGALAVDGICGHRRSARPRIRCGRLALSRGDAGDIKRRARVIRPVQHLRLHSRP